jgi:oligopeptide/dipeptide ABC transporter ATP-binding protein
MLERPTDAGARDLVEVIGLKKHYPLSDGSIFSKSTDTVHAVDGVSFGIRRGEVFGLVGESGCGKSTIGRMLVQLTRPTAGQILFDGQNINEMASAQAKEVRKSLQIIFQDPFSSLDPRMRIGAIVAEPLRIAGEMSRDHMNQRVKDLLERVGLPPESVNRFPHEFSGGQRQRIAIARALALQPKLLVADECVSALDVSVKLQILELLDEVKNAFGVALLFISHDLAAVRFLCDRVAVLYLGKVMEIAESAAFFRQPRHPYSQALMSAVPTVSSEGAPERIVLQGEIPSPVNPPTGCRFRTRCWRAEAICSEQEPPLADVGGGHFAACHFA